MTCGKGFFDDPACCEILGLKTRYWVGYYTVIDCSSWEDSNKHTHQYEICLLGARLTLAKKFKRRKEDKTSLVGCMYKASRDGEKSTGVGDDFDFVRDVDLDKLFSIAQFKGKKLKDLFAKARSNDEEMKTLRNRFAVNFDTDGKLEDGLVPFNYTEVLKPKSPQDIRELLGGYRGQSSGGGSEATGQTAGQDPVPF